MPSEVLRAALSAEEPSASIKGNKLAPTNRAPGRATLQFGGAGNYEFVLEGKVIHEENDEFSPIGTFTQDDESKIATFDYSLGVEYRLRRTSGSPVVLVTG